MKKIGKNSIKNIEHTDTFDNTFLFDVLKWGQNNQDIEVIFLSNLLKEKENIEMLEKAQTKPASYSNVYSPQDELEIFQSIFDEAISQNKKIHIVGITLKEEIEILEKYYLKLGFFNEDINCFDVDFSKVLVSASVKIENIMWRGSDYKRMGKEIFFNPPVRESGQVKAMFKGINRGVTAGLYLSPLLTSPKGRGITQTLLDFLSEQILQENILPLTLGKVLKYNLDDVGIVGENNTMKIKY
ncbi:hypothetical protein LR004_00860 [Candidatus Gracilibacteria bacterium]|nr:hypothetical protein [Candidatus Gracilibacteria bacterium]